jgi:hypothetical protein
MSPFSHAEPAAGCTVIVTVDLAADDRVVRDSVLAHARAGLDRFHTFDGYLGGALHLSTDGGRIVQVVRFASEPLYLACRDDPSWDAQPTTAAFFEHVTSGAVSVDARVFDVVATSGR